MTREDFKIAPKYYATNNLTYIIYNGKVIDHVEIYDNLFYLLIDEAQNKWESQKKKRKPQDVANECERKIKQYIDNHKLQSV